MCCVQYYSTLQYVRVSRLGRDAEVQMLVAVVEILNVVVYCTTRTGVSLLFNYAAPLNAARQTAAITAVNSIGSRRA